MVGLTPVSLVCVTHCDCHSTCRSTINITMSSSRSKNGCILFKSDWLAMIWRLLVAMDGRKWKWQPWWTKPRRRRDKKKVKTRRFEAAISAAFTLQLEAFRQYSAAAMDGEWWLALEVLISTFHYRWCGGNKKWLSGRALRFGLTCFSHVTQLSL